MYLATTATRTALNVLQSARARHETSIVPHLPSLVNLTDDPIADAARGEALERATYLLMERLTAAERAAFVLRVGFDYPYAQIASIIDTTQTAARQLVSRARKHLAVARKRVVDRAAHQRLFRAFRNAAREGDATSLEIVLAQPAQ